MNLKEIGQRIQRERNITAQRAQLEIIFAMLGLLLKGQELATFDNFIEGQTITSMDELREIRELVEQDPINVTNLDANFRMYVKANICQAMNAWSEISSVSLSPKTNQTIIDGCRRLCDIEDSERQRKCMADKEGNTPPAFINGMLAGGLIGGVTGVVVGLAISGFNPISGVAAGIAGTVAGGILGLFLGAVYDVGSLAYDCLIKNQLKRDKEKISQAAKQSSLYTFFYKGLTCSNNKYTTVKTPPNKTTEADVPREHSDNLSFNFGNM